MMWIQIKYWVVLFAIMLVLAMGKCFAQNDRVRLAFWNVENLFDTINQIDVEDGEFTPSGKRRWNTRKYLQKIELVKDVIIKIKPTVMGVCEIENEEVLNDIMPRNFEAIHFDSPDYRGIDVGLIFDTKVMERVSAEPIKASGNRRTRDILRADLKMIENEINLTILVVHLPSRRNNDPVSRKQRDSIMVQLSQIVREIKTEKPVSRITHELEIMPRVVVMGDFNMNPDQGVVEGMVDAMKQVWHEGKGSYAYGDVWMMYDRILTDPVMPYRGDVFSKGLIQKTGRFKGYPAKGKPSDHLPVFLDL